MNNIHERPGKPLEQVVNDLLQNLLTAQVTSTPREGVMALGKIAATYETAAYKLHEITRNQELTLIGKRERGLAIFKPVKQTYQDARADIDAALARDRRFHEGRSEWPRTAGTIADREALMANARQDLKDLLASVQPSLRAERLAFAVRNGSPAVQELVLADKYAERVLWPSLPESSPDAIAWAAMVPGLVEELHPGGETVRESLKALRELDANGVKLQQVMRGIQEMDLSNLIEQAGLGSEATPGDENPNRRGMAGWTGPEEEEEEEEEIE